MPSATAAFTEEEVTFQGPAGTVAGTLAVPQSRSRGSVLLIAGSGAGDRNGDVKKLKLGVYRDLAHAVSAQGFVSLRYDKPGAGASAGDHFEIGFWDLVETAAAAAEFLRARAPGDPVIIIGHSEGAVIGPAVNARTPVQGMVLLSGACESLGTTLERQQERGAQDLQAMKGFGGVLVRTLRLPDRSRRQSKAAMAKILASDRPSIRVSGVKVNAAWLREQAHYDVRRDLPKVACPTLAITGSLDLHVLPEHAEALAQAVSGPAEWYVVPDLTHVLRTTKEPVSAVTLKKLYTRQCKQPVDEGLLRLVQDWLLAHFPSRA